MTEVSRRRGIFGRLLAAFGLAWVFWGFFGPAIGLQFGNSAINLPVLPGIVVFFIGRALMRGARRSRSKPERDAPAEVPVPPRPEQRAKPAPRVGRSIRESPTVAEPVPPPEMIEETLESPEPVLQVPEVMPSKKTSAEMVAEARQRYGRRP